MRLLTVTLLLLASTVVSCGDHQPAGTELGTRLERVSVARLPLGDVQPFYRESTAAGDEVSESTPVAEHLVRTVRLSCGHVLVLVDDPSWSTAGVVALEVAPTDTGWEVLDVRLGQRSCVEQEPWLPVSEGRIDVATDSAPGVLCASLDLVSEDQDLRIEAAFSCEPGAAVEGSGTEEWLAKLVDLFHPSPPDPPPPADEPGAAR